ncbi:5640_t:CDS:2, partial [Paraglomus brasilianum]
CIVLDQYRAFAVDFDKSKTVSHLKTAILEQKKKSFSDIEADQLTLWKVNIPQSNKWEIHTGVDIKQKFGGIELDDLTLIAKYFQKNPQRRGLGGTTYQGEESGRAYEGVDLSCDT